MKFAENSTTLICFSSNWWAVLPWNGQWSSYSPCDINRDMCASSTQWPTSSNPEAHLVATRVCIEWIIMKHINGWKMIGTSLILHQWGSVQDYELVLVGRWKAMARVCFCAPHGGNGNFDLQVRLFYGNVVAELEDQWKHLKKTIPFDN